MYIDLRSRRLCFGQHAGKRLCDTDTGYLRWMLRTIGGLSAGERCAVEAEFLNRAAAHGYGHHGRAYSSPNHPATAKLPAGVEPSTLVEIIAAGRQTLARRYHPDLAKGDAAKMVAVNTAADFLEQQARALVVSGGAR